VGKLRIMTIFGTRPEAIKMAPVVQALKTDPVCHPIVCTTGQHRHMLDQVLDIFAIRPDVDLDVMTTGQSLTALTAVMLSRLEPVLVRHRPDVVLVHGDTTTTLAASLAAFYQRIPIGHVEAGLRTHDRNQPWPEEANRRLTDVLADFYFAPTAVARSNLIAENVDERLVHITGNTVIDALKSVAAMIAEQPRLASIVERQLAFLDPGLPVLLVTGHRRESFGEPFEQLCAAIAELAASGLMQVVYPVHLNPNVQEPVRRLLANLTRVHLIPPLDYVPFVGLMQRAHVILTDSGGIQEEAPALGKPVFVMRNVTERPEAVEAGGVRLVGTNRERIVAEVSTAFTDSAVYARMSRSRSSYGDGAAAERIVGILAGRPVEPWCIDLARAPDREL
jgi:UDP-N-acetylglucosamine 2-epimerase